MAWLAILAVLIAAAVLTAAMADAFGGRLPVPSTVPPPAATRANGPVANERYLWRPVSIGGGGYITGLAHDAAGATLVARSDVYGAYRWDAGLDRWVALVSSATMPADRIGQGSGAGVYEVAVAPGNGKRIYLAMNGRVYRSDDGGVRFAEPAQGAPFPFAADPNGPFRFAGPFLAVSPADPNLVYLGTPADGLWRSRDGGAAWDRVAEVPAALSLNRGDKGPARAAGIPVWFDPIRPGRVLAAPTGLGLFAADAPDARFSPVRTVGGPQTVWRGAFDRSGAFYAIDRQAKQLWLLRGNSWELLSGQGGLMPGNFAGIATDPSAERTIVTDAGGQAWCSTDAGVSWTYLTTSRRPDSGEPPWLAHAGGNYFASGQIAFDPARKGRLWVAAGTGPYYADLGEGCRSAIEWRSRVRGIEELVAQDIAQTPGHAPVFAALDFGIHVKSDLNRFSDVFGPRIRPLIAAQDIDWSPSNPAFLVTNASDTRDCCAEDGDAILAGYSLDGGATWRKFASLPQPPGTAARDPWRMAYGTIAVAADRIDNIVWLPAYDRAPFFTLDRGNTWQRVVFPGEKLPLTGSYGWKWLPRRTLAADRVLPGTFYLYHSGNPANPALAGLWITRDGGRTWRMAYRGAIAPDSQYAAKLRSVPFKAGHLFFTAGVLGGNDTRLRRSIDGGQSWSVVTQVDQVDDIAFGKAAAANGYPAIYLSGRVKGRYGIWRSIDNTGSWQLLAAFPLGRLDRVNVIGADPDVFGRVYVGYTGSGWLYGEPAECTAAPFGALDNQHCVALASAANAN